MSTFSVPALQEKLNRLGPSQDSIETLSLWIIQHKAFARASVDVWLASLLEGSADQRLVLFYLANDILQNGRRKGADHFVELFKQPLRKGVSVISGEKSQTSIERMLRIWRERKVYEADFILELERLIEPSKPSPAKSTPHFQLSLLEDAITELRKFEGELQVKSSQLCSLRMDASQTSSFLRLKDKSEGDRFSSEFDEASGKLQDYCECLGIEVNERINLLAMLRACRAHHTHLLAEATREDKDHAALGQQVAQVGGRLRARLLELERAQQTATSDPQAQQDITDSGDMEIESDNEAPEAPPPPTQPLPLAPAPLQGFPPASLLGPPGRFQHPATYPPLATPPPVRPPLSALLEPTTLPPGGLQLPRSAHFPTGSSEPPPQPASLPRQPTGLVPSDSRPASAPSLAIPLPQITSAQPRVAMPIILNNIAPNDAHPSLDERLQNFISEHSLPSSLLPSPLRTEGAEDTDRPYSPSNNDVIVAEASPPSDGDSLPTPLGDSPTPTDASPVINMDNPIMQALYMSPPSTAAPPTSQGAGSAGGPSEPASLLSSLDTAFLQSVLSNVGRPPSHHSPNQPPHQTPNRIPPHTAPTSHVPPHTAPTPHVPPHTAPTPLHVPPHTAPTPRVLPHTAPTPRVPPHNIPAPLHVPPHTAPTPRVPPHNTPAPLHVPPHTAPTPRVLPHTAPTPRVPPHNTPAPLHVPPHNTPAPLHVSPHTAPTPRVPPHTAPTPHVPPHTAPTPHVPPHTAPTPRLPSRNTLVPPHVPPHNTPHVSLYTTPTPRLSPHNTPRVPFHTEPTPCVPPHAAPPHTTFTPRVPPHLGPSLGPPPSYMSSQRPFNPTTSSFQWAGPPGQATPTPTQPRPLIMSGSNLSPERMRTSNSPPPPLMDRTHPPLDGHGPSPADKPAPSKPLAITPKLTSLLDQIFPQLSKSLKERKRKPVTAEVGVAGKLGPASKASRVDSPSPPKPAGRPPLLHPFSPGPSAFPLFPGVAGPPHPGVAGPHPAMAGPPLDGPPGTIPPNILPPRRASYGQQFL